ncbi:GNAT family N-acetyltransferase [Nocardia noduli]|uniref:GNAT family N-acetyltransferase n=1 Tax=Nocardia noduli TaxID=2815722 RepID=UPI001C245A38|nr:GNAT family N-acetyltransferase [Nocardia noduli]
MTITSVTVRTAGDVDLPAVLPLAVAFYAEDGFATGEQALRRNLATLLTSSAARVALAYSADRPVGFAVTTTGFGLENGPIAELEDLFVVPSARRHGVAGRLIEDSAGWARERGCGRLELVIAPNGGEVGHLFDFYLACGFRDEGRSLVSRPL